MHCLLLAVCLSIILLQPSSATQPQSHFIAHLPSTLTSTSHPSSSLLLHNSKQEGDFTHLSERASDDDQSSPHQRDTAYYKRQYAFGSCTNEEYYEWFYNEYDIKCRFRMGNLTYDEEKYVLYCDKECGPPYLDFLESCGGEVGELYADYYRNLCYENSNGIPCAYYFLATEYLQPTYFVEENCELPYDNDTACSFDCFVSLHQIKYQMGCCVNNLYNHSVPSDLVSYGLWSKCKVSTPGYCSGDLGLVHSSFPFVALLIVALGAQT